MYLGVDQDRTPTEFAQALCLNKGHVSMATDSLCRHGYLLSARDESDRRTVHYEVTESGRTVVQEIRAIRDEVDRQLLKGFTKEEYGTLQKLCTKLLDNIEERLAGCERKKGEKNE